MQSFFDQRLDDGGVSMGFRALRYQENYRAERKPGAATLDLDTWPGLSTFLEIEGPGEEAARAAADALGLDFARASYGSVDEVCLAVLDRDILAEATPTFA